MKAVRSFYSYPILISFIMLGLSPLRSFALGIRGYTDGLFRSTITEKILSAENETSVASASDVEHTADSSKDPNLYFLAAQIFEFGDKPDLLKARECYRKASEAGHPGATVRLAWFLIEDADTFENRKNAIHLTSEAAKSANPIAQLSLNTMLALGYDGESRRSEGITEIQKQVDASNPEAEYLLGSAYLEGSIVPQNPVKAVELLRRAAEVGHINAQLNLGICYGHGLGVEQSHEAAFGWYLKAAEQGDEDAQHNIGNAYLNGRGIPLDIDKAIYWFRKSAKRGLAESMAALAICLTNGPSPTPEAAEECQTWLKKASALGNPLANWLLGSLQIEGKNAPYNFKDGLALLTSAANAGLPQAQLQLANLLRYGHVDGLSSDQIEAMKWCLIAAESGFIPAKEYFTELRSTLSSEKFDEAVKRAKSFKPIITDTSRRGKLTYLPKS